MSEKNIPCEVIEDLLPNYIDGLTGEVTNQMIEEHLKTCEACQKKYHHMKGDLPVSQDEEKEIDYLKKVKRDWRKSLLAGLAVICLIAAIPLIRVFVVGKEMKTADSYTVSVEDDHTVHATVYAGEGYALRAEKVSEEDGVVRIAVKTVPAKLFGKERITVDYKANQTIQTVEIGDEIAWQDGYEISHLANALYKNKNLYVGDMPANQRLANTLGISYMLGSYTNELETEKKPYGWIMHIDELKGEELSESACRKAAGMLIACVDNLDHVRFTYGNQSYTFTQSDYEDLYDDTYHSLKDYAASVKDIEILLQKLWYK